MAEKRFKGWHDDPGGWFAYWDGTRWIREVPRWEASPDLEDALRTWGDAEVALADTIEVRERDSGRVINGYVVHEQNGVFCLEINSGYENDEFVSPATHTLLDRKPGLWSIEHEPPAPAPERFRDRAANWEAIRFAASGVFHAADGQSLRLEKVIPTFNDPEQQRDVSEYDIYGESWSWPDNEKPAIWTLHAGDYLSRVPPVIGPFGP